MDIELTERGNGGEMTLGSGDVVLVEGVENVPYLAMFGGADWWANDLLTDDEGTACAYTCRTEKALRENALTSAGREAILQAAIADLQEASTALDGDNTFAAGDNVTTVEVDVVITGVDSVLISGVFRGKAFAYNFSRG